MNQMTALPFATAPSIPTKSAHPTDPLILEAPRIRSASPADELADIRADLARLQTREAALVALLLARPELRQQGRTCVVELDFASNPVFDTTVLPAEIRDNPKNWRKLLTPVLTCRPSRRPGTLRPGWPLAQH